MSHELTHVAQQRGGSPEPRRFGGTADAAERQADKIAATVTGGAPAGKIVDPWLAPGEGQLTKTELLDVLQKALIAMVDAEMGPLGRGAACPYIQQWFAKNVLRSAAEIEQIARRFSGLKAPAHARDYVEPVVARARVGLHKWKQGGVAAIAGELAEAGLGASGGSAPPPGAVAMAPQVQKLEAPGGATTLGSLEGELGAGRPLDPGTASRMSSALGADVSGARIHTGPIAAGKAAQANATAFAVGQNVVMGGNAPAPGTLAGDALLAHELAHTAQQKRAAEDPDAREQPIGEESAAAERDADRAAGGGMAADGRLAALGTLAGRIGDVMRTGLQMQRCAEWKQAPELEQRLGLSIDIAPTPEAGKSYIVGQKIKLSLGQKVPSDHAAVVYHWSAIDARGNEMRSHGPEVELQIFWPGTTTLRVKVGTAGADPIEYTSLERTIEAVRATDRAEQLVDQATKEGDPPGFETFRAGQHVNLALLSPDNTPSPDQAAHVMSGGANPVKAEPGSIGFGIGYAAGTVEPAGRTFKWDAQPLNAKDMPDKLGAAPKTTVEGRTVYDLGAARTAQLSTAHKGIYVVHCQMFDAGRKAAEASWIQTILDSNELEAVGNLKEHMVAVEGKLDGFTKNGRGDPDLVAVTAFHVDATSGAETQLSMFIGKRTDGRLMMINATPGLKLTEHRIEFTGSSSSTVLDNFDGNNKYPPGAVRFHIPGGKVAGIDAADRTIKTTGDTTLGHIAGALGFGALVLSIAAIPFTGGASATATVLFLGAAATGVAAGAFSLADHLKNEDYTAGTIALDCLQMAASVIDLGVAVKALRSSPALVVANRAVRYAMWSNLAIQGASAVLISMEAIGQIEQILEDDSVPRADKIKRLTKLLATLIVTGGLLVLSYRSLAEAKTRMTKIFPEHGKALKDLDAAALGLVDDTVLQTLSKASKQDLERLAAMLRADPALATRLPGRTRVLGALKGCKTNEPNELELQLFKQRLSEAGLPGKNVGRILEALEHGKIDAATAHLLSNDDLLRLKRADDALAGARTTTDEAAKQQALATAKAETDRITGVSPRARDELRAAIAHINGTPDPAFLIDPVAALRTKFPSIPPADLALLGKAHPDALVALENASVSDVKTVIAKLKTNAAADVDEILRSYLYKARKPARKTGSPYEPPGSVGSRLEGALANLDAARKRGYPWGFPDKASYDKFLGTVKASLDKRKIPSGDVRVHGSAMHNQAPGDIDVAVIVDEATFKKLGAQFTRAAPDAAAEQQLGNDQKKGKIASQSFYPGTKPNAANEATAATNGLSVQVSVIKSGSEFDVGPYLSK
jgi:hypothetical protein